MIKVKRKRVYFLNVFTVYISTDYNSLESKKKVHIIFLPPFIVKLSAEKICEKVRFIPRPGKNFVYLQLPLQPTANFYHNKYLNVYL